MQKKKLPPLVDIPGKPGMALVNRYMPDATPEEKEEACYNVERFIEVLVQIDDRIGREAQERHHAAATPSASPPEQASGYPPAGEVR